MYSRILRFAPSPNGHLHLGHAYSALLNHDMARELGGRLLLRIEDIDAARCRPDYEEAIYEDLRWLGISWQEPVRRQSEHFADYEAAIAKLEGAGTALSEFRKPRRDRGDGRRISTGTAAGRAILTACRFIRAGRANSPPPSASGAARPASLSRLRLAMDAAVARAGVLTWTETGAGPHGQTGLVTAAPQMLGRRRAGAQGLADQLSPLGRASMTPCRA